MHRNPCLAASHEPRIPIRAMFPYVSADPSCHPQDPKNPTPNPERPATGPANQAPASPDRFHGPATGVAPAPPACMRTSACTRTPARVCAYLYGHGHTCTAMAVSQWHGSMVTYPWHAFISILTLPGTVPPRPAAGLRKPPTNIVTQVHWAGDRLTQTYASNPPTQIPPSNPWGACTASLRDASASATTLRRRRRQGGQHLHV